MFNMGKSHNHTGIPLKICTSGCRLPKQCFINLEWHTIIWHLNSIKLNIGKKLTGLEIMTLNRGKF